MAKHSSQRLTVILLAAGQGTRMRSDLPKVLHPVAGDPMITRLIRAAQKAGASEVRVVTGHGAELVEQVVLPIGAVCFPQERQLGTADAVRSAKPEDIEGTVMIMNGDHPLITADHIKSVLEDYYNGDAKLGLVTIELEDPKSYGRIVRQNGQLKAIVEVKDASAEALKIKEVNPGIYVINAETLNEYLPKIGSQNAQNEFYLTDIVAISLENGEKVETLKGTKNMAHGVNTQEQLAHASKEVFRKKATDLMENGVVIIDPDNTYVEEDVEIGASTVIYPGCYISRRSQIGKFCVIEPNCFITSTKIADSVQIKAGSYLEGAQIANKCTIGPYARLRPNSIVEEDAKIGNFVELKNVRFGAKSKASHLTYLGDAEIGEDTNIGCGTITCNYAADKKKYVTKIGSNVFVGSDSQFVAPVEIGDGAIIGSGSTITKDVPAKSLAVARGKQVIKENYQAKSKDYGQVKKAEK